MDLSAYRMGLSPLMTNSRRKILGIRVILIKFGIGMMSMKLTKLVAALLVFIPVFVAVALLLRNPNVDRPGVFVEARVLKKSTQNGTSFVADEEDGFLQYNGASKNRNGLIAPGFDKKSCLSRYQSGLYHKISSHIPSSYLLSRLRNYEQLHRLCGPHTEPYNKTLEKLNSGHSVSSSSECKYVVWISYSGLGNRILTITSAFLYALLTNRVLLVDPGNDMSDLFCEPFPQTKWLLPLDQFPIKDQLSKFHQKSPFCHGNMLKNNIPSSSSSTQSLPSYVYLHLVHDYDDHDKLFFCDEEQNLLGKITWLMMKTDNYFVPSLFLIPSFQEELSKLFPQKETIFHHLGRYLFHPSNHVWGLIMRYYQAYLAKADERIGIQIRTFESGPGPYKHVTDQVLSCVINEKLLPEADTKGTFVINQSGNSKHKAVLVTSLISGYFETLRNLYWEHPTISGDLVGIYQPSHEGYQQTEKKMHNKRAWAEIYLLSMSDVLVTSAWSTFGYVAQGLGGLKAWILYKPENETTPNPPCGRVMSMEPCFHAPPFYDCKAKKGVDTGAVVPHVRHCEDISWGLKLVESIDQL